MSLEVKLIALLSILLAFAGLGAWGQYEHVAAVKAKAQVTALETRNKGLQTALDSQVKEAERKDAINVAKQRTINKLTAQAVANQQKLNEALKANRAWADAPVPDSVWDAIAPASGEGKARPSVERASPDSRAPGE